MEGLLSTGPTPSSSYIILSKSARPQTSNLYMREVSSWSGETDVTVNHDLRYHSIFRNRKHIWKYLKLT